MNINKILFFIAALAISFNTFALEHHLKPKIDAYNQVPSVIEIALNQDNLHDTLLAKNVVASQTISQSSTDNPSEFLTAISVYLIIITVYSLYWLKFSSKNIRD